MMKKNLIKLLVLIFPYFSLAQERVFVVNEGNFGSANGSLSFLYEGQVENDVFSSVNALPLGDVVQSMTIIEDYAYVVVNGSAKVEVLDAETMESVATITDLSSPRYIAQVSANKAYITDWNGVVAVLDLSTHTIDQTIAVGVGPENLAVTDGYAFVANKGGWGLDSTVSVIDVTTDQLVETIVVGDKPAYVQVDVNGGVWVLSEGNTVYDDNWNVVSETVGKLVKINASTLSIDNAFEFEIGNHPMSLVINEVKDILYFKNGSWSTSVYAFGIEESNLPSAPLISRNLYGIGAHAGMIYGADAMDFSQSGWVFQYTEEAELVDSFQVGIIPNGFCFEPTQPVSVVENITVIKDVNVFPNPVTQTDVVIDVVSNSKINTLKVFNVLGEFVEEYSCQSNSCQLDVAAWSKGVYTLILDDYDGRCSRKIIVQ